ncbi:ATP-binding protein [Nocardia sp. XZ_19_385]|uniref:HAMP domain-containing sensor histidine kinase n=1 Tax=Nocardia sp. XZ_19_385 TaxID=2769488 RepID=UPI00188DE999|nr:ATP-binding protein [Nocardia sp. XZ_19_385]
MRDAARSGKKRWALGNWDLRWKVTAVLAVPLAVAVGLGVSRITSEFSEAGRLEAISENIEVIPAVTGLRSTYNTVVGSQLISLAPGTSIVTDQNLTDLDKALVEAEASISALDNLPKARAAFESMITQAKTTRAQGKAPTPNAAEALAQIDKATNESVTILETATSQVSDPGLDAAKLRLVDSINTRGTLVPELAAFSEFLRGSHVTGLSNFFTTANTERQLLNMLAHRFPDGDPAIADLRAGVDTRISLVSSPDITAGKIPIGELKNSMTTSLDVYDRIIAKATKDIEAAMSRLSGKANTDAWTYTAVVLATILAALLLAVFVARSMIVPLHRLRLAALRVAESDLPHEVAQLRNGAAPEDVPLEPMPVRSSEEIGQLARAVDDIHGQALRLASDQAQMRSQVNDMFETLARRSKSLVDHQLSLIEAMEYDEKDPRLLENLFRLDHLAARMRRNGDNLLILAGTKQRRAKSAPVEIADVLRAAISEVEDYERVKLGATPRGSLIEPAASDLAHLFAELLDNALRASPPETDVKFTFAQAHDQGLLIEVADRGIGMPPAEMVEINRRLEQTAEPGPDTARHMGLFVVGRLAERHGLTVRLRPTFDTARDPGVTVTVHVPVGLIVHGKASVQQTTPAAPVAAERPRPSAASSMQMRAIQRTPQGNVMVTVDPGVSGPVDAPSAQPPGTPAGGGGLPQRQPGSAAAAAGMRQEGAQSGPTLRPAPGQAQNGPQRGKLAAASLPKRNLAGGPPPRQPGTPDPAVSSASGGLPPRDANGGLPQRQPGGNGAPQPTGGGLPQRQPGANGAPGRQPDAGLPQRDLSAGGLPSRQAPSMPQRDANPIAPAASGLPQREPGVNGPTVKGATVPPPRVNPPVSRETALPQREPGAGSVPQRPAASTGLPQRQPSGLPQRDPSAGGLPQRDSASSGLPQRDSASTGLPQRDSASTGLPQRDSASTGLPQRDPASTGLPQRDPASTGLPQRQPAASTPPQREPGGLPQREPGGLPQRQPGASPLGLPQREPGASPLGGGLPRREPAPTDLPQRAAGLSQRERGAADVADSALSSGTPDSLAPARDPGKHSMRSDPAKAASFFQTRLQPAVETGSAMDSPIFAEMMSAWLSDPNPDRSQVAAAFESPGDEGWQAARRASEAQAEKKTAAGLPQRDPGGRLVPGGVTGAARERAPRRDPEMIRSSLSRHQQGVRDGRSMKAPLTGEGDR